MSEVTKESVHRMDEVMEIYALAKGRIMKSEVGLARQTGMVESRIDSTGLVHRPNHSAHLECG